jgi:transposase
MHYLIKDTEFAEILKFLSQVKGIHKRNIARLRRFIEAICYVCRSGCQWRLLPYYYGDWRAVHKRFKEWSKRNIWQKLFAFAQKDPDMEVAIIDSTIVRAHACAAGYGYKSQEKEALGRSKGGFSTKIHIHVDALGNPIKFILTPGNRNDITQAKRLIEGVFDVPVIADKIYGSKKFIDDLNQRECEPVIPPKSNSKQPWSYDEHLYEERHLVECFIGKIKHFRRIFSRFDKAALSYLSFLHFAGALIWFR